VRHQLRQPVVAKPRHAALQEHVRRLDVEVNQRTLVQRREPATALQEPAQQFVLLRRRRHPPGHDLVAQRLRARERHHQVRNAVDLAAVLDRHQVRMVDLREPLHRFQFRQHRLLHFAVVDLQELDRVVLADRHAPGPEHQPEHAPAQLRRDLEPRHVPGLPVVAVERFPVRQRAFGGVAHGRRKV
jgi:hypothetical protein